MTEKYFIDWRGPYTFKEVTDTWEGEGYNDFEDLYAITWEPPQLQSRTKYIGMVYERYIGKRLRSNHEADTYLWEKHGETSIKYYLGEIILDDKQRRSKPRVKNVEAAIIYFHYQVVGTLDANIQNTRSYIGRDLEILNQGKIPPQLYNFQVIDDEWGYL